jgi:hypothetical protein
MEIITERLTILSVSDKWDRQYPVGRSDEKHFEIGRHLRVLDLNTATSDDLERIIGNRSWSATPKCSECGTQNVPVVEVGEEQDYESATAWLCKECVSKAFDLMRNP